jgi:hypothetical protein
LIYVAGGLIGLALIWVTMGLILRWLQDLPLGPFSIRATGAELRESEQRAVAAQRRLAKPETTERHLAIDSRALNQLR